MNDKIDTQESNMKNVDSSLYRIQNEPLLISEVFSDEIFNNFNKYCFQNNINMMGDLNEFNFNSLYEVRYFVKERVPQIFNKYMSIMYGYKPTSVAEGEISHLASKDILIESVFHENRYNIFRDYCSMHEITTIADMEHFNFDDLLNENGIGVGKIAQIRNKYIETITFGNTSSCIQPSLTNFSSECGILNDTLSNAEQIQQYNIHQDYYGIDVSFVFDEKICVVLRKKNINTISDLSIVVPNYFKSVSGMGEKRVSEALATIKFFELPINGFVTASFARIRQESEYPFYSEVVYGKKTMEAVGIEHNNLSRQQVEQKKSKIEKYAFPVVSLFEEVVIKSGLLNNTVTFNFETLSELIGSYDNATFAKDIFENCNLRHIKYSKDLDLFFVDMNPDIVVKKLKKIALGFGNLFSFLDEMIKIEDSLIADDLSFIDVFSFSDYLLNWGYRKYQDYYIKGHASLERMVDIIMKKYFDCGIENNSEDIAKLRGLLSKEFGVQSSNEKNDRNLWVILERPGIDTVLWGRSKKIHIDHVIVNNDILTKVKDRITESLLDIPQISVDYVYEKSKEQLNKTGSNIYCKDALYGVLQYYFSNEFSFRKLSIKANTQKANVQKILEEYIFEHNGSVSMKSVNIHFSKWTPAMINTAINFNNNILSWDNGNNLILASYLQLQEDFIERFKQKVDDSFIEDYTNGYMIASAARVLFLKNKISDDSVSAYSLSKYLLSNEYFFTRRPHILKKYTDKQFTSSDLILSLFRNKTILSYNAIKERLVNDFCFDILTAGNNIAKSTTLLFQLDIDQYCIPSSVTYGEDIIFACLECVNDLINRRGYALLSEIDKMDIYKMSIEIDGIQHSLNAYSVKSIIYNEHPERYRFIVRKNNDWRYDNLIIVPDGSSITTFTDAILYILQNEFEDIGNFVLPSIENFLREKELIVNKIPDEFFKSDKVTIDEYERVFISKGAQDAI